MTAEIIEISVVVPLFNEEESATPLYEQLTQVLRASGMVYETIFVDDGSSDLTFEVVRSLAADDPQLRIVKFRRNYGQTPAMAAGIDNARGEIVVTMDGDLQNDPRDIPMMVQEVKDGCDIVVGWRHNRQDKLVTRKIPSVIANWLIGKVTGVPIKDNGCSLKAYRRSVIANVPLYSEMHRFIPAMASITGARIKEVKVRHHARQFGTSKYGLSRVYRVLLDLLSIKTLVTFSSRPLMWFVILSIPALLAGIGMLTTSFVQALTSTTGFSSVLAGSGLIFTALAGFLVVVGVLCELVYNTGDFRVESLSGLTAVVTLPGEKSEDVH